MDPVLVAKIISMVLLGGISFLLGLLAMVLYQRLSEKSRVQRSIISCLLCFGGGVLIATSVIHMLPEVRETFALSGIDLDEKPVAEILTCVGFFLVYFIEELTLFCFGSKSSVAAQHSHVETGTSHSHSMSCISTHEDLVEIWPKAAEKDGLKVIKERKGNNYQTFDDSDLPVEEEDIVIPVNPGKFHTLRDFMTILALTFHAVFEGLAVGLSQDANDVWKLFGAVAMHKYVIAFCFGVELMANRTNKKLMIGYIFVFAIFSPLGIGMGIGINEAQSETVSYAFTVGTLQALSAGTILYVVVFEVLQRERQKDVNGLLQLLVLVLGFVAMVLVELDITMVMTTIMTTITKLWSYQLSQIHIYGIQVIR
eukprot:maker-scaffold19_size710362-snap-gene-0.21 protein:Tk00396 transcript:maker-scaffold19_size710362-snap-gene-0.21-mRNA-1 annotation:"zinc transporter zip1"